MVGARSGTSLSADSPPGPFTPKELACFPRLADLEDMALRRTVGCIEPMLTFGSQGMGTINKRALDKGGGCEALL